MFVPYIKCTLSSYPSTLDELTEKRMDVLDYTNALEKYLAGMENSVGMNKTSSASSSSSSSSAKP